VPKHPPVVPATVTSAARTTPWLKEKMAMVAMASAIDFASIVKLVFIISSVVPFSCHPFFYSSDCRAIRFLEPHQAAGGHVMQTRRRR
jgi:hypothetical protein